MDTLRFTTVDGQTFEMPSDIFVFEVFPGSFGAPPTQFATRQGYKQDGVTELGYTLQPRDFEIDFWRAPACDRLTYWANRAELLEFFRPNRGAAMTFTLTRQDHSQRSLTVRANPGPQYPPQNTNDWNVRESLSFTAFDPVWYDPAAHSVSLSGSSPTDLIFPITFPILFGASGLLFSQSITYAGSWKSYPTIVLTGPYTTVTIYNDVAGASIFMTTPILAGQTRTLTLTPGAQSVIDQSGNNAFGELGPLSDLINFALVPTPVAPGGVQTVTVNMIGGSAGVSAATLSYYDRYFGI